MKRALVITAAMGLALAGCSQAEPEPEVERSVVVAQEQLPEAEVEQSNLPFPFQELPTFTLDFDALPLAVDDVFVGLAERGGILEFSAVDSTGAELWSTQRPASCSGYAFSEIDGESIVVLTDEVGS